MKRIVLRRLPDGRASYVFPFHISMKGLESLILYRDDDDYDAMVKILCLCARRKNVIVIIYTVVSNHCHVAVLAGSQAEADDYGQEAKRMYSMWFRNKYGQSRALVGVDIKAIALDSDWYVRNALAYIPRNALDNGCNVNEYKWSGFNAMFRDKNYPGAIPVKSLTKRQRREIMHTGDNLDHVPWLDILHFIPYNICQVVEEEAHAFPHMLDRFFAGQLPSLFDRRCGILIEKSLRQFRAYL